jgi:hypothetical protein
LESDPGLAPAAVSDPPPRGHVSVTDVSTEVIEIEADVPEASILLVTDNYSASWTATALNGSIQDTYRVMPANYTLRAIPVTPGHHRLRLEYRPIALTVGTWITLLSLVVYVAVLVRLRSRRTPSRAVMTNSIVPAARFTSVTVHSRGRSR